ncbi:hypothetical protein DFJ73DRAFT_832347, partial [Zopfochytrium polystomum]
MSFAALDVVAERVPPVVLSGGGGARLVVLRDVVQHLPLADGVQAIANIEATSGAEYLLTNWHHHPWTSESEDARYNAEVPDMGDWFPVDVFVAPFNFSRPIMWIREGWGSDTKVVGLWRLPALFRGDGRQLEIEEADWTEAADRIITEPFVEFRANTASVAIQPCCCLLLNSVFQIWLRCGQWGVAVEQISQSSAPAQPTQRSGNACCLPFDED